jgi:broad specificity phosphatase PhoE
LRLLRDNLDVMGFEHYTSEKISRPESFEQDPDVPIIDIVRHGESQYRQILGGHPDNESGATIKPLDFNPDVTDFRLDSEHLDLTEAGIQTVRETAEFFSQIIDAEKELVAVVSSPAWRAHSSALVLEDELRKKGVEVLDTNGLRLAETIGDGNRHYHSLKARPENRDKKRKVLSAESGPALELNFLRFVRHMNNVYQWLKPETIQKLEGKRLRIICLAHGENVSRLLAEQFGNPDEKFYPENGQIVEIAAKSQLKSGGSTETKITLYPSHSSPQKKEALVVRGFSPMSDAQ